MIDMSKYDCKLTALMAKQKAAWEASNQLECEAPILRRREVAALEKLAGIEWHVPEPEPPRMIRETIEIDGEPLDVVCLAFD